MSRRAKKPYMQRTLSADELRALLADGDEDAVHLAVVQHLYRRCNANVFWTHVPNGGHRHPLVGRKLKEMGTRAGVPDLVFSIGGRWHALELKVTHGALSPAQRQVIKEMEASGVVAAIAHGVDQAVAILEKWGVLR